MNHLRIETLILISGIGVIFLHQTFTLRAQSPCYEFLCGDIESFLCGSNGVTYLNGCQYSQAQCKNSSLYVVGPGPCESNSSISESTTEADNSLVEIDSTTPYEPSMVPTDCNDPYCSSEYNPVCGNDMITYSNPCQFSKAQCSNHGLVLNHYGRCKNNENCTLRICPMIEESICASDGKTYRNECEFGIAKCYDQNLAPISSGPCPDEASQIDPSCMGACEDQYRPVCGTDGKTYPNVCFFEKARCKNRKLKIYKFEPC